MARPRNNRAAPKEIKLSVTDMFAKLSADLTQIARKPNILGYEPHEKQIAFHSSLRRKRLYIGGNQSGKTTGGNCETIYWLLRRHPYRQIPPIPIYGRSVAVDFQSIDKIIIGDSDGSGIKRWLPPSELINGSWEDSYNKSERTLSLANGSSLEFKSYDQEVLQHAGRSLHFIHFDEPPPKSLYIENNMRTVARFGDFEGSGSWWMTYTPIFGMDWTYDEIYLPGKENPDDPDAPAVIEVDMTDNPYLTEEAIKSVLEGLSEDDKIARKHGRYVQLGGNIFKDFTVSTHCINEADLHELWGSTIPPRSWEIYFSLDHGLNAPSAIYWHAVSPDGEIITFREIYKAERLVADHAKEILEIEKEIGRAPFFRTGDPAIKQRNAQTGSSIQQAYAEHGIWINVDSIPKEVSIGITKMRQHMRINPRTNKPYWRIFECPNLVKELGRIHWETWKSLKQRDDNNPLEKVHKHNDHAFDSCKYFFTFMPDLKPTPEDGVRQDVWNAESYTYNMSASPIAPVGKPVSNAGWTIIDSTSEVTDQEYSYDD